MPPETVEIEQEVVTTRTPAPAPAPAATPAPAPTQKLIDERDDDPAKPVQATWPDDWRAQIAADEKNQKVLKRFDSPKALFESYRALQQRLSSGELKAVVPFPEKGTAEEQAVWRKENGIPEAPDKYDLKFEDGLVIGEDQKPFVDSYLKYAHEHNIPANIAKDNVAFYFKSIEARTQERIDADNKARAEAEDALRAEWGNDYRPNLNRVKALLTTAPDEIREKLADARLPDGTAMFNNPDVMRWLVGMDMKLNPHATVVPAGDGDAGKRIDDRIADLTKLMGNKGSDYWKGPKAEALQKEYRDLIETRQRMK